ncbi:MAG: nucleotidyltransferase family protein [Wujia sp.]
MDCYNNSMSVLAVIAEFHPYHNGHHYLLEEAMSVTHADYAVSIMSGNFLQRGAVALWNKYTRAAMAVSGGFDLILELPVVYATGSAGDFAMGAVSMLEKLHCVDYLAFGVETPDEGAFEKLADTLVKEPVAYRTALKEALSNGNSFPAAKQLALASVCGEAASALLMEPNNTLALAYLCALKKLHSSIKPIFIKRISSHYHDTALQTAISSATAIRTSLEQGEDVETIKKQVPKGTLPYIPTPDQSYLSDDELTPFVQSAFLQKEHLSNICDLAPHLYEKLSKIPVDSTYEEVVNALKSKDVTRSRIARVLLHAILGYKEQQRALFIQENYACYANILALRKASGALVKLCHTNSEIPVITKKADFFSTLASYPAINKQAADTMWHLDLKATALYNAIYYNHYHEKLPNDFTVALPVL